MINYERTEPHCRRNRRSGNEANADDDDDDATITGNVSDDEPSRNTDKDESAHTNGRNQSPQLLLDSDGSNNDDDIFQDAAEAPESPHLSDSKAERMALLGQAPVRRSPRCLGKSAPAPAAAKKGKGTPGSADKQGSAGKTGILKKPAANVQKGRPGRTPALAKILAGKQPPMPSTTRTKTSVIISLSSDEDGNSQLGKKGKQKPTEDPDDDDDVPVKKKRRGSRFSESSDDSEEDEDEKPDVGGTGDDDSGAGILRGRVRHQVQMGPGTLPTGCSEAAVELYRTVHSLCEKGRSLERAKAGWDLKPNNPIAQFTELYCPLCPYTTIPFKDRKAALGTLTSRVSGRHEAAAHGSG